MCFSILKAFQIWEKALDLIKQFFPDIEEPLKYEIVNKIN